MAGQASLADANRLPRNNAGDVSMRVPVVAPYLVSLDWTVSMKCTTCDEGYVERDRSYGDYMAAVREECPDCEGTLVPKCCYCGNAADVKDEDDYLCNECYTNE